MTSTTETCNNPNVEGGVDQTDGLPALTTPKMAAPGRIGLDHQLAYNVTLAGIVGATTGTRWMQVELPGLMRNGADGSIKLANGQSEVNFDLVGGTYVAQYGAQVRQTLVHVPEEGIFRLQRRTGSGIVTKEFNDFDQPWPGGFVSMTDEAGNVVEVSGTSEFGVTGLQKTIEGETYELAYDYTAAGNLHRVTLQKLEGSTPTPIRRTVYAYYDGVSETSFGSEGDLKSVTEQEWVGEVWQDVAVTYMRYFVAGESGGNLHDLKYFLNPQAYAQMVNAGLDPLGVPPPSNEQVAEYATISYEYSAGIVSHTVIQGIADATGADGQVWERTANPNSPDPGYNVWSDKWTLLQADGNTRTKYVNWLGLTILDVLVQGTDDSRKWCTYYKYNDDLDVVLVANPSGVSGFDEALPALVGNVETGDYPYLKTGSGLFQVTTYYNSTTASSTTPGGVADYLHYTAVKEGLNGTEILQRRVKYIASLTTVNGDPVYVTSEVETFPQATDQEATKLTTSMEYLWYADPPRIQQRKTIWPVVPESQNGSGEEEFRLAYFDELGNVTWTMCELGMITKLEYDTARGLLVKKIVDVGDDEAGNLPLGWTLQPWTHQEITTDYTYDIEGRLIRTLGPAFQAVVGDEAVDVRGADWRVYIESPSGDQTWAGQGFQKVATEEDVLVNPVNIVFSDKNGMMTDSVTSARSSGSGALSASDTFLRQDWTGWSHADYNAATLKVAERVYHTIPPSYSGLEGINQDTGESGVNYDETTFSYDPNTNQLVRTVSPGGTISENLYDAIRRPSGSRMGTDETNLVQLSATEYDSGAAGGDSNVTRQTVLVDDTATRVTDFTYDFRNRRITTDGEVDYFQKLTYDNMNRVVMTEQFDTTAGGNLVSRNETMYDARNRVFRTKVWGVNPATGATGNVLTGNNYYDPVGHLMRAYAPGGGDTYTAYTYDTVGRRSRTLQCYGAPEEEMGTVIEKQRVVLDKASHVLYTITSQRNTDASTMRDSYLANWYDGAGRLIARANYGNVSSFSYDDTPPDRSNDILVDSMDYDTAGRVSQTLDPMAIAARTEYDDASRVVRQIENYVETPDPGDTAANRTTETTYNADGKVVSVTLKMATLADDQTTIYTFGTTLADSAVASSMLLRSVQYGDSSGAGDRIVFTYNRQGQVTSRQDQNGTVHEYLFDGLGRTVSDLASVLGTVVDGKVRRIDTAYDVRGQVSTLTSMGDVAGASVVNQVKLEYNEFRQLVRDFQSHNGAVNEASCPKVEYSYAGGTSVNYMRPNTITYPNGRLLVFRYGANGSMDDHLSRLQAIQDNGTTFELADYKYLGLSTVVRKNLQQPVVTFDLWGGTSGVYEGFDRFQRIIKLMWQQGA